MKSGLLTLLLVFVCLSCVQVAHATTGDDFRNQEVATQTARAAQYAVPYTGNPFLDSFAIWGASGGPVTASFGFPVGNIMVRAVWFWLGLLGLFTSLAIAKLTMSMRGGGATADAMMPIFVKLLVVMIIFVSPALIYSTAMTVKESGTLILSYLLDPQSDGNAPANYGLTVALANANAVGPDAMQLKNVMKQAALAAFQSRAMLMVNDAEPATAEIYNQIAATVNRNAAANTAAPLQNQFPIMALHKAPPAAANATTPQTDAQATVDDSATFDASGSYTDVSSQTSGTYTVPVNATVAATTTDIYWNSADVSALPNQIKTQIPTLLALLTHSTSQGLLNGSKAYDLPAQIYNTSNACGKAIASYQALIGPAPAPTPGAVPPPNAASPASQKAALLQTIATSVQTLTGNFLDLSFVQQYKNHADHRVRAYWQARDADHQRQLNILTDSPAYTGIGIAKFVLDFENNTLRPAVVGFGTTLFEIVIEVYIMILWFAAPFWFYDKTEKAFTGAANTLFMASVTPSFFAMLMIICDLVFCNIISSCTGMNLSTALTNAHVPDPFNIVSGLMEVEVAIMVGIANLIAICLSLFFAPKAAKAFLNGGNVLMTMMSPVLGGLVGGGMVAGAVAAAPVAAAAAGAGSAASAVGGKLAASKAGAAAAKGAGSMKGAATSAYDKAFGLDSSTAGALGSANTAKGGSLRTAMNNQGKPAVPSATAPSAGKTAGAPAATSTGAPAPASTGAPAAADAGGQAGTDEAVAANSGVEIATPVPSEEDPFLMTEEERKAKGWKQNPYDPNAYDRVAPSGPNLPIKQRVGLAGKAMGSAAVKAAPKVLGQMGRNLVKHSGYAIVSAVMSGGNPSAAAQAHYGMATKQKKKKAAADNHEGTEENDVKDLAAEKMASRR